METYSRRTMYNSNALTCPKDPRPTKSCMHGLVDSDTIWQLLRLHEGKQAPNQYRKKQTRHPQRCRFLN